MEGLADKVIVITGASSGIGVDTAKAFAVRGSKLVLVARREGRLRDVAKTCVELGLPEEKILVVVADVTNEADVSRIIQSTVQTFNTIDVLVNNAGGASYATFENCTLEQFDEMIALNLRSVFMTCKAALPYLLQSKGSIINVSATGSYRPFHIATAYSAAKAGLDHFTRNLAKELGPKGVRANIVSPGPTRTEFITARGGASSKEEEDKIYEHLSSMVPMGRVGEADDVAKVIVFIASQDAAYVTGALVDVTGGLHLAI